MSKYISKDIPRVMSRCWAQRIAPGAYHFTDPKPAALEEPPSQSDEGLGSPEEPPADHG